MRGFGLGCGRDDQFFNIPPAFRQLPRRDASLPPPPRRDATTGCVESAADERVEHPPLFIEDGDAATDRGQPFLSSVTSGYEIWLGFVPGGGFAQST